jgi:hypothetical protein
MIKHHLNRLESLGSNGIRLEVAEVRHPADVGAVPVELLRKDRQPRGGGCQDGVPWLVGEVACHGRGKDTVAEDTQGMVDLADADALEEGMGKDTAAEGNLGIVDVEKACDRSRDSSFQHGQRGCKDPMALIHLDTGEEVDVRHSSRWHYDEDVALPLEEAEDASSPFRKSWALHPREAAFSPGLVRTFS